MKRLLTLISFSIYVLTMTAQNVSFTWTLNDKDNLSDTQTTGDEALTALLVPTFLTGSQIGATATMTGSNADEGYSAVNYTPYFTTFTPTTRVAAKTAGHCIRVAVRATRGHTFKPTAIAFDAAKVGTDGGNVDVYYQAEARQRRALPLDSLHCVTRFLPTTALATATMSTHSGMS